MPTWLTILLTVLTAAAAVVVASLLPSHGWELGLKIALSAAFAGSAVGLPRLDQWKSQQDLRLKVELKTDPPELTIPMWTDGQDVIASMVAAEESICLASLTRVSEPPRFTTRKPDKSGFVAEPTGDLSLKEYEELAAKKDSGAQLTAEEEQALAETAKAIEQMRTAVGALASSIMNPFTRRETRTPEEYREEVQRYLSAYPSFSANTFGGSTSNDVPGSSSWPCATLLIARSMRSKPRSTYLARLKL